MEQSNSKNRLILANGEHYIEPLKKTQGWGSKKFPRSYDEARTKILTSLSKMEEAIETLPTGKFLSEAVIFCLRLNENFIAKSYYPGTMINEANFDFVGSRKWYKDREKKILSKILFIKCRKEGLGEFKQLFDRKETDLSKNWIEDVRKIDEVSLLKPEEQILGFSDWNKGFVEIVLHPLGNLYEQALQILLEELFGAQVDPDTIKTRTYRDGITFISGELELSHLEILKDFNPLRTAHPLPNIVFPKLRSLKVGEAPNPYLGSNKSRIKVGVFDGGVKSDIPLLENHVNETDLTAEPSVEDYIAHGSAVSGCVLYGPLNDYQKNDRAPQPKVFVESFRVFPSSNPNDLDLYEIINHIENVVPHRSDIKVYNLSFGPEGAILEDDISRFTFALDLLSYQYKVLFNVAAGNDGEEQSPLNRIQAPSDIINGMGIGAYSFKKNGESLSQIRAPYSSIGPGREGCKVKPDVVAFGGCGKFPVHLVGLKPKSLAYEAGTSYSAPIVSGLAGELIGRCGRLNSLMARTLLVHTSEHPDGKPDLLLGHGFVKSTVDDIIQCGENAYTVLYQSSLRFRNYAKLPIPFILLDDFNGKINFKWTIAVLSRPDPKNPDEYANFGLEDTFYPHSRKFVFSKKVKGKSKTQIVDIGLEPNKALDLKSDGWTQGNFPATNSGESFEPEAKRRENLKWDTVVRRSINKNGASIYEPFLVLHAMERNDSDLDEPLDYGVAITVEIPKFKGDLYAEIVKIYNKLEPLEIRGINQIMVPVN